MQIRSLIMITLFAVYASGCQSDSSEPNVDTTSPTVSITSPANSSIVVDSTTIIASPTDDVGVAKLEFYIDGSVVHTRTTSPWQYTWNLQLVPHNSIHSIVAKAYDAANNLGVSPTVSVLAKSDTSSPTIVITAPQQNSIIVDSVLVIASVFDAHSVQRVEFIVDGSLALTRLTQPWEYRWDVRGTPNNTWHTIGAKAYDGVNNSGISEGVSVLVKVDTTRPTTSITSPLNNTILSDSVLLEAIASDNQGVVRLEFYIDGTLAGTRSFPPWSQWWVVEGLPENSTHSIFSKAYDAFDNVATSSSVSATVINNRALRLDGVSTFLRLYAPPHLTSFGNQITVESWVKPLSYGNGGTIVASGNQNEYALRVRSNGKLGVTMALVNPQVNNEFIGTATLALNTWYHVAFAYDGSVESIFVNGILDTSISVSGNVNSSQYNEDVCIGAHMNSFQTIAFLHALLDDVRIWNTNRTQAQIQASMNSELSGAEPGLVGYWKLNGNHDDYSPYHYIYGTLYGNDTVYVPIGR